MKKILLIGSLVIVGILVFGAVGYASAQTILPRVMGSRMLSDVASRSSMMSAQTTGNGMTSGARGGMMGQSGSGLLHDYMLAGFAEAFGLDVADLQARIDAGDTMYDVALELGYTQETFTELMVTVRTDAINQALADGVITQEQADWMLSRLAQRQAGGFGTGTCTGSCQMSGRGGMGGGMRGANRGTGTCIQP
jgi:hypothetical protein